jgi:hypothetical protein
MPKILSTWEAKISREILVPGQPGLKKKKSLRDPHLNRKKLDVLACSCYAS